MSDDSSPIPISTLSPSDAAILDAFLATRTGEPNLRLAGAAPAQADTAERTRRLEALLKVLDQCPVEDPPADLAQRTLSMVAEERQRLRFAQQVQALAAPPAAFHWRELIAVAAVVLLGLSLVWPMLAQTRNSARQLACQSNLSAAGLGMAGYAADNNRQLPRVPAPPNAAWSFVGQTLPRDPEGPPVQSNSAHLFVLVRQGYVAPLNLACPDNPNAPRNMTRSMTDWPNAAAPSYSYQNQNTPHALVPERFPYMALLADRTPLFVPSPSDPHRVVYRGDLPDISPTNFHGRSGQNILRGDGSVLWSCQPVLGNGDNIWLAGQLKTYRGTEAPAAEDDSFLVP